MNCTKRWTLLAAGLLLGALLVQPAEAGRGRRGGCGGGSCGWSSGCGPRVSACYGGGCSTPAACPTSGACTTGSCTTGACSTGAKCSACVAGVPHTHKKASPSYAENSQPAPNTKRAATSTRATTTRVVRPNGTRG